MRHWQTTGNSSVANGHPNRKYLYLLQYDRYHYNSDDKHVFDHDELAESDNKCLKHLRQPEIAIWPPTKTGSSYTTGTTTDSVEIPTACPRFSTMVSPNKVSPSDCDNDRQPEMVM